MSCFTAPLHAIDRLNVSMLRSTSFSVSVSSTTESWPAVVTSLMYSESFGFVTLISTATSLRVAHGPTSLGLPREGRFYLRISPSISTSQRGAIPGIVYSACARPSDGYSFLLWGAPLTVIPVRFDYATNLP